MTANPNQHWGGENHTSVSRRWIKITRHYLTDLVHRVFFWLCVSSVRPKSHLLSPLVHWELDTCPNRHRPTQIIYDYFQEFALTFLKFE